jgi:hypothetical protein
MKRETPYQKYLKDTISEMFPGCVILKNDPQQLQGIPDLTILFRDRWAILEVKRSETSEVQPNQEWYIDMLNEMSFASFIYPENESEVLRGLSQAFKSRRSTRISKR